MDTRLRTIILNQVKEHFPRNKNGRTRTDAELILTQIQHVLWTGAPWRSLATNVSFQTIHRHFMSWARCGVFKKAYETAIKLMRRPGRRREYHCIDTTFIKNIYGMDCKGRNPTDRGRSATKLSAIVDGTGLPISIAFFPGNIHDVRTVSITLDKRVLRHKERIPLYADKAYYSQKVFADMNRSGYIPRVTKRKEVTHRVVNRKRNVVERTFSWLDKSRRLILRYDATIVAYESFTWLACMRLVSDRRNCFFTAQTSEYAKKF